MTKTPNWRPKYYLALILWSRNETARARDLLAQCGSAPDFAPFYATRASAFAGVSRERSMTDLLRAAELDPREWRFGKLLVERYVDDRAYAKALETARRYCAAFPESYILGMLYAKSLLLTGHHSDAADTLARLHVLPYEGSTEARALYREAQLMLAIQESRGGRADEALRHVAAAREWPENLGAGKPYPENVDERLEDWLEGQCLEQAGRQAEARRVFDGLASSASRAGGLGRLLVALALTRAGRQDDANRVETEWAAEVRDPALIAWGRRLVAGERLAAPATAPASEDYRVLNAWLLGGQPR
jgi:predicted Zn-dependent protease